MLHLPQLLNAEEIGAVLQIAQAGQYSDGRATAGSYLHGVKNNLQHEATPEQEGQLNQIVIGALMRNAAFCSFALPRKIMPPRLARYEAGMGYGSHVDQAFMGQGGEPMRSDLSLTLFLSDPTSYQGGELVLETPVGEQEIKLPLGDAVVYGTTVHHRVATVDSGTRLVAVTWMQSFVADTAQRQLLHDLRIAKDRVRTGQPRQRGGRAADPQPRQPAAHVERCLGDGALST